MKRERGAISNPVPPSLGIQESWENLPSISSSNAGSRRHREAQSFRANLPSDLVVCPIDIQTIGRIIASRGLLLMRSTFEGLDSLTEGRYNHCESPMGTDGETFSRLREPPPPKKKKLVKLGRLGKQITANRVPYAISSSGV